jgi:hypothetical protein
MQRQRRANEQAAFDCSDVIRAEFRLSARPRVGDSAYVNDGTAVRGVRWSLPEAKP